MPAVKSAWAHISISSRALCRTSISTTADAEMVFVPQQGELRLWTEFGIIDIEPGEIAVIPPRREDPRRAQERICPRLPL